MEIKQQNTVFLNRKNHLTWFEFWHPRKDAAMDAEAAYNQQVFEANREQDLLEAQMSDRLTGLDNQLTAKKLETIKTVGVALVCALIIFVIVKYI